MLKSILAFVFFTILGFYYSGSIGKRQKAIEGLKRFNNAFLINVRYAKKTIPDFIDSYSDEAVEPILKVYKEHILSGSDLDFKGILPKDMLGDCENYFSTLGKSDADSQVEFLKSYCSVFDEKLSEYSNRFGKKKELYGKLGILSGAGAFVLLL